MNLLRLLLTALIATALLAASSACAVEEESILDKETLRIGVRYNLPLIGERGSADEFEGFEIDVAEYIAAHLGADVEFVAITAAEREPFLLSDRIDLAVATYSITQDRKQRIDFAGPYVLESFNVMVHADNDTIVSLDDLEGKIICEIEGSNVFDRISVEHGVKAVGKEAETYEECLDDIEAGTVDAITTDEFILAGIKYGNPDLDLEILDIRFSRERVGVGMQPGDTAGCEAINRAITEMYADGTMERLLDEWFSPAGLDLSNPPIPQFEGCE